jgi:hypothetical protein
MKTEIQIEIRPFPVPGYVDELRPAMSPKAPPSAVCQELDPGEYQPAFRTFALRELSADDLSKLCNEFTAAVFKAAGKDQPPKSE